MELLLIDSLPGRLPGILDTQLAELAGYKTKRVNEACKRSTYAFSNEPYRYRLTADEWRKVRDSISRDKNLSRLRFRPVSARPFVYSFEGAFLVLSRIRANLSEASKRDLLKTFSKEAPPLIDYGTGRREEHIVNKIKTIFAEIVTVIPHYPVKTNMGLFLVDVYLKEWNIVIEIDEFQHRWNREKEKEREFAIIKALGCRIIRFHEDSDSDELINQILKKIQVVTNQKKVGDAQ
jgi:hypothetical protein